LNQRVGVWGMKGNWGKNTIEDDILFGSTTLVHLSFA
jgi:hypothetical protein